MVSLRWFGHACFAIKGSKVVVTDPFHQKDVGYPTPNVEADIVTVSHDHFDHNKVEVIRGNPKVIDEAGEFEVNGVKIKGVETYHDKARGAQRGKNIIFKIELDGIKFCHLGDLGHVIEEGEAKEIGEVDVLMIPVGGYFTIEPEEAEEVVKILSPKVVVPMHYKTEVIDFPIKPVDVFLKGKENVKKFNVSEVEVKIPEKQEIWVLKWG